MMMMMKNKKETDDGVGMCTEKNFSLGNYQM